MRNKLHKLTTKLVDYAKENNLIIAIGDLERIQEQNKGRVMNRKLHRFPHFTIRKMLKYKCKDRGLEYKEVSEAYTSQLCCKCGKKGNRNKGPNVTELRKSDINGSRNISKRAPGKPEIRSMLGAGATVA